MTAAEVKAALRRRHRSPQDGAWACVEEACCGWNSRGTGGIDLLAIGAWKTAKVKGAIRCGDRAAGTSFPVVAYEVKVDRSDFRRELEGRPAQPRKGRRHARAATGAWPEKAQYALDRSNYFFFAVPRGLLSDEEIEMTNPWKKGKLWVPSVAGLIEVGEAGRCYVRRDATPNANPKIFTSGEIGELVRHALDPASVRKARLEVSRLQKQLEETQATARRRFEEKLGLKAQIEALEEELQRMKTRNDKEQTELVPWI